MGVCDFSMKYRQNDSVSDIGDIYRLTCETLKNNTPLGETKFNEEIEYWRKYSNQFQNDDDFFNLLVTITFYSGFRSKTVSERLPEIRNSLGNYQKVKNYTFEDVERILKDRKVIANAPKVCSTILNARQFERLINEHGSFKKYLQSFNFKREVWNEETERLYADLMHRFYYLSEVTTYHFLMDLGAFCIKPDRQIVALLESLDKVKNDDRRLNQKVVDIGREMAKETGENIRVVDIVLVTMRQGDEFGFKTPICPSQCDKCKLNSRCRYASKGID